MSVITAVLVGILIILVAFALTIVGVARFGRPTSRTLLPFEAAFVSAGLQRNRQAGLASFSGIVGGRTLWVECLPGCGLMLRVSCQSRVRLGLGARVALVGIGGEQPTWSKTTKVDDSSFAGITVWSSDPGLTREALDPTTRAAVLRLLSPGREVRTLFVEPGEIVVRALAIGERDVTEERVRGWLRDVLSIARRIESTSAMASVQGPREPGFGSSSVPKTVVVSPRLDLAKTVAI